ncbi:cellulose binding domain-containing protein, partial [Actinoplanes subtropicus]|uniref:cellulose binding domain-containing protein n=1 Tax=Actinoplanes subtropicus TaxID=543632 RepID=UPI0004C37B0F
VADNVDGVHPNDTGFQKMSDAWYPVPAKVLGGSATPTPQPTTTTTPATVPPSGTCSAAYRVVSQWTGGFQGEVTVANGSSAGSTGWNATF